MVEPMAAVVAAEDPEMAAKNMPATQTTWARPPQSEPTMDCAKLTRRLVTPPADMKDPASMKKGTAMKEKESIPVVRICGIITRGECRFVTTTQATDRQSEKATGTPMRVRSRKIPMNMNPISRPLRR